MTVKKTRDENEKAQNKLKEQKSLEAEPQETHYRCTKCGQTVNFHFIMKFIKDSGMCPSCFHE